MGKTPELLCGNYINPFAGNAGTADFIRGSALPAPTIETALKQVISANPNKQIRIIEGMGYEIFSLQQIKGISKLPPGEKEGAITEIIDAISRADLVYIEEPLLPKHLD